MLAGQFIHASFQRLSQAEIITVKGEHFVAKDVLVQREMENWGRVAS
jgi:hypothetical protein